MLWIRGPGSGAFSTPGSEMGKKSRSGSGIFLPDHISESLEAIFRVKTFKFFDADADPDPGSENLFDPGYGMGKIRDKHLGSATLVSSWVGGDEVPF
jgi:hypothetical protein